MNKRSHQYFAGKFTAKKAYKKVYVLTAVLLFQVACAHSPESQLEDTSVNDPFEPANRAVQGFNDRVDSLGLKPSAKGYATIVPEPMERAVGNFFSNVAEPVVAVNQFLQGKVTLGIQDSARFIFNTTFGIVGLIDISSPMGLEKHNEDFGQTFAVWGLGSGPHLNLPLWGPTNLREGAGSIVNAYAYPLGYLNDTPTRNRLAALLAVNNRAELLSAEAMITGDRYIFIRDVYNQRREYLIKDGEVEDAFLDGELDGELDGVEE
ncbi:MAG: VacJ family lipoprotein [Thiotrichaceae bacterium]